MKRNINEQGSALLITIIVVIVLASIGAYVVMNKNQTPAETTESNLPTKDDVMMEDDNDHGDDVMIEDGNAMMVEVDGDVMMEDEETVMVSTQGVYQDYSQANYDAAKDQKRVLFFHATWCPTCKSANKNFEANLDKIPDNVVLLKTDYDSQKELKSKYSITYQHTFVQVDQTGKAIKVWNGGGINELINNVI